MPLPDVSVSDIFTLGVIYVLCASIAVNIETYAWLEFLNEWLTRLTAWFWATLANLVAAESDAAFREAWRQDFYEGRHRRGNMMWRQRWASWPTQAWPTLAAYGDHFSSDTVILMRPTICSKDWWKDLRERDVDHTRGTGWNREDRARSAARRAAGRQVPARSRRGTSPRRAYAASTG